MLDKKRQTGLGPVGWIISIPIFLLGLLIISAIGYFIYCEANKAYWDKKVTQMCEKAGGVHVYEKMTITGDEGRALRHVAGKISVPLKELAPNSAPAYAEMVMTSIRKGYPKIDRIDVKIVRRKDQKVIAEYSSYSRIGGDFPTVIVYPSRYSCPKSKEIISTIHELFVIKEK